MSAQGAGAPASVQPGAEGSRWADAVLAAALFAVDPVGLGGVCLRAGHGPVRDRWLAVLRQHLPAAMALRRVPHNVSDDRLLGGLDLAATLNAGRPIVEQGILAGCDGGIVVLAMAERLPVATALRMAAVVDTGQVALQRDGFALQTPATFGLLMLDEGDGEAERPPAALCDRVAFHVDLTGIGARDAQSGIAHDPQEIASVCAAMVAARERLSRVRADDALVEALCAAAMRLGIGSLRAPLLALRVARAAAALAGHTEVSADDAALAARLVLAPRATTLPEAGPAPENDADHSPEPEQRSDNEEESRAEAESESGPPGDDHDRGANQNERPDTDRALDDVVLDAAQAAIPAGLLAQLQAGFPAARHAPLAGRAGVAQFVATRGRPVGVRRGDPRSGGRLNVLATLRAAAPWQRMRQGPRLASSTPARAALRIDVTSSAPARAAPRIDVRRDDFRITRYRQRSQTTTIFVVDASGSSALHRLAEAKGAVQLLLADCYVRRDSVALLAFRGRDAELLLPPTRSLVRAKRTLASMPGGGATPLAAGIDAAVDLAEALRRRGQTPVVVLLTDGRANVARDGTGGRARASEEAMAAARAARATGITMLLVDTSVQPQELAERLAVALGARYLPLPQAGSAVISSAIRSAGR